LPSFERPSPAAWSILQDEQTCLEASLTRICRQHPEVTQVLAEVRVGPVALRPLSRLIPQMEPEQILRALRLLEDAGVVCHVMMKTSRSPQGLAYLLSPFGELHRPHLRRLTTPAPTECAPTSPPDDRVDDHQRREPSPARGTGDDVARRFSRSRALHDLPRTPRPC
jgi:hypothetical protein